MVEYVQRNDCAIGCGPDRPHDKPIRGPSPSEVILTLPCGKGAGELSIDVHVVVSIISERLYLPQAASPKSNIQVPAPPLQQTGTGVGQATIESSPGAAGITAHEDAVIARDV